MKTITYSLAAALLFTVLSPLTTRAATESIKIDGANGKGAIMMTDFYVYTKDVPYYVPFLIKQNGGNKGIALEITNDADNLATIKQGAAILSSAPIQDGYYYVAPHSAVKFLIVGAAEVASDYSDDLFMEMTSLEFYRTKAMNLTKLGKNGLAEMSTEAIDF